MTTDNAADDYGPAPTTAISPTFTSATLTDEDVTGIQKRSLTMELIREKKYERSDSGRGRRLADYLLAEGNYRFTPWRQHRAGTIWDPKVGVWRVDVAGEIRGIATKVAQWDREDIAGRNIQQLNGAIRQALSLEPSLLARREDFDKDPYLLAHPNATTTNLLTGESYPSRPEDMLTAVTAESPAPGPAPVFEKMLDYVTYDDKEMQDFLWEALGFLLPATLPIEKSIIFFGPGGTGKSTMIKCALGAIGHDSVAALPSDALTGRLKDDNMSDTVGKRVVLMEEFARGAKIDSVAYTRMVSRGIQHGRGLHVSAVNFQMTATLLMSLNYRLDMSDEGVERRPIVIPFMRKVPRDQFDPHIDSKLKAEGPQVLAKMIEACVRLAKREFKFNLPEQVAKLTKQWTTKQDVLESFCDTQLLFVENGRVHQKDLNDAWKAHCILVESTNPWQIRTVIDTLKERGHRVNIVTISGSRAVKGVTLLQRTHAGEYTVKARQALIAAGDPRGFQEAETGTISMEAEDRGWDD